MKGFIEFIRERGIVGFAVGFILGGAVTKVVSSFVTDIINPILGIILSKTKSLETMSLKFGKSYILWGHFISVLIDFIIISFVVYIIFKITGLEKIDKKK